MLDDNRVEGIYNSHVDNRILPQMSEDWVKAVVIDDVSGQAYVPLEVVERIMAENEELRESLFLRFVNPAQRAYTLIASYSSQSTSDVLKKISAIESFTNNGVTGKFIFNYIYGMLNQQAISFRDVPPNQSKLQWLWKQGYLPIVCSTLSSFHHVIFNMHHDAPNAMKDWYDVVSKKMAQVKKITKKQP